MSLRILLVGKGAREHALAWKLAQSPSVEHVYVVPGNGGTATCSPRVTNVAAPADGYPGYVRLAQEHGAGLAVIGPDGEVRIRAGEVDVSELKGLLRQPGRRPVTLKQMDAAIRRARTRRP